MPIQSKNDDLELSSRYEDECRKIRRIGRSEQKSAKVTSSLFSGGVRHTVVMGFHQWIWGMYEYLCFLVAGVIIAINDGNPIERIKRKYFLKWPAVRHLCLKFGLL